VTQAEIYFKLKIFKLKTILMILENQALLVSTITRFPELSVR